MNFQLNEHVGLREVFVKRWDNPNIHTQLVINKGIKIQWGSTVVSIIGTEQSVWKVNLESCLQKINWMDHRLKYKSWNYKTTRRKHRRKIKTSVFECLVHVCISIFSTEKPLWFWIIKQISWTTTIWQTGLYHN